MIQMQQFFNRSIWTYSCSACFFGMEYMCKHVQKTYTYSKSCEYFGGATDLKPEKISPPNEIGVSCEALV